MKEQDWYTQSKFSQELYEQLPFLDIFDSIPTVWDDPA